MILHGKLSRFEGSEVPNAETFAKMTEKTKVTEERNNNKTKLTKE